MKYLSLQTIRHLKDKAMLKSQYDYMIIRVLAETGMRIGELTQLQPSDIINDEKQFQIVVRGKGSVVRHIDISSSLYNFLKIYIKQEKLKYTEKLITCSYRNVQYRVKAITGVNCHVFRHSYAIHLLRSTKNIRYVQKQLGHRSLATTQIYLQFMEFEREQTALEELV